MTITSNTKPTPIEVWLSQKNIQVTCRVVTEDESTDELTVDSLSMRGAQREITGYLISQGYRPIGRWQNPLADDGALSEDHWDRETTRKFASK